MKKKTGRGWPICADNCTPTLRAKRMGHARVIYAGEIKSLGPPATLRRRSNSTLQKTRGGSPATWGDALEALKHDYQIPNNVHGQIMDNGDFVVNGATIDNLGGYVH